MKIIVSATEIYYDRCRNTNTALIACDLDRKTVFQSPGDRYM